MKTKHLVKRNDSRSKFPSHFLPGVKLLKFYKLTTLKSKKFATSSNYIHGDFQFTAQNLSPPKIRKKNSGTASE